MSTLANVAPVRGQKAPQHIGLTSNVSPENTQKGVSVRYAPDSTKKWYVMRATYHREKKAYDYLINKGIECYLPLRQAFKIVRGKRRHFTEPLLPNFLFVYTTLEIIKTLSKDINISFLNHYYNHFVIEATGKNPPLTVPYTSMMNFIKVTSVDNERIKVVTAEQCHFKSGDLVRVKEGDFKGIVGKVARLGGQQRVVVEVKGVCMVSTAYIPNAFLEIFESRK